MKQIPYGRQNITQEDIEAVVSILKSDMLTQGPSVGLFEKAFAEYVGSEYAVAVSNGTAALHLSILALGVNPDDKVITTPITFVASANCVKYAGASIVFSDIDPDSFLIDLSKLEDLLANAPYGTFKGIIPVDFSGRAVNLESLKKIAVKYGCWIIEDACHAPGGFFVDSNGEKQYCGNGKFAELSIFSFHPVKHITSGEGGMITTNSKELYKKLLNLRTHGIQQDKSLYHYNHGVWYYEMQELGYNYRLTDIQAALGISQLKRAGEGIIRRKEIAENYYNVFKDCTFVHKQSGIEEGHAYHLYIIEVDERDGLLNHLRSEKIFAQIHYIPVHLMPYYGQFGWKENDFPLAESYYKKCISLPIFPTLTNEDQMFVIKQILDFYK
jgi:UDP-4-amino-4,6-dideoxy-N-acetyl-beta-L-altrosamine transaminase